MLEGIDTAGLEAMRDVLKRHCAQGMDHGCDGTPLREGAGGAKRACIYFDKNKCTEENITECKKRIAYNIRRKKRCL